MVRPRRSHSEGAEPQHGAETQILNKTVENQNKKRGRKPKNTQTVETQMEKPRKQTTDTDNWRNIPISTQMTVRKVIIARNLQQRISKVKSQSLKQRLEKKARKMETTKVHSSITQIQATTKGAKKHILTSHHKKK